LDINKNFKATLFHRKEKSIKMSEGKGVSLLSIVLSSFTGKKERFNLFHDRKFLPSSDS
jgi:hypothetical protein